jgi:hypothetical protein
MDDRFSSKIEENQKLGNQLREVRKDLLLKSEKFENLDMDHNSLKSAFHSLQN